MKYKLYKLNGDFIKELDYEPQNFTGFLIHTNGIKRYFKKGLRHREDGPAVLDIHGNELWYLNDKQHRLGGPYLITCKGIKEYKIHGKGVTKTKHDLLYSIMKLKGLV